ncbi:MAG: hypothetical protein WCP85_02820 [Mariniphaga sp.]
MDKLDKIFFENRADFDEEPQNGHFERFEQRLNQVKMKNPKPILSPFLKVAAVLVIVLLSANLFFTIRSPKPKVNETAANRNEINEASFYYTRKINTGIRELETMANEGIGSPSEIVQIKHELSEMDSLFLNLQQEYKANPNDERIINAMIEYYQTKLDIVNTIKTDLENVKQQKRKYNENTKM